jgi:hypothetical protein
MQVNISGIFGATPDAIAPGDPVEFALKLEADTPPSVTAHLVYTLESTVHTFQETGTVTFETDEDIPDTGRTVRRTLHVLGPGSSNAKIRVTVTPSGTPSQTRVTGVVLKSAGVVAKVMSFFGVGT